MKKLLLALLTTLLLLVAASAALADSPSNYICTNCDVPCARWVPVNSEGRSYHIPCCDLCENLWLEDLDRLLCKPVEGSATCTTPAVCSVCGFVDYYGSEPDPNAHDISDFYYTGPDTHYRYCLNGCYTMFDEGPHTGGDATCADYPICTVCDAAYGNPDPNNHDWGSWSSLATTPTAAPVPTIPGTPRRRIAPAARPPAPSRPSARTAASPTARLIPTPTTGASGRLSTPRSTFTAARGIRAITKPSPILAEHRPVMYRLSARTATARTRMRIIMATTY